MSNKNNHIVVIFRYDDYHASRGKQDYAKDKIEEHILEIFQRLGVPLTMAVVPNMCLDDNRTDNKTFFPIAQDSNKFEALRSTVTSGKVEVALHGWDHEPVLDTTQRSEFIGRSASDQANRLKLGKETLEELLDIPVTTFIPPWNSYDEDTLKAAADVGFMMFSGSLWGQSLSSVNMAYLPATCSLSCLNQVIDLATRINEKVFIVVMFHEFSFKESNNQLADSYAKLSINDLESLLVNVTQRLHVQITTLGEAALYHHKELGHERVAAAARYYQRIHSVFNQRLLWHLSKRIRYPEIYYTATRWRRISNPLLLFPMLINSVLTQSRFKNDFILFNRGK